MLGGTRLPIYLVQPFFCGLGFGSSLPRMLAATRRDGGLKMGWTKPLPTGGLWVLLVGWISGEDPIDPEVMSAREFCGIGPPAGTYGDVGGMRSVPQIFSG